MIHLLKKYAPGKGRKGYTYPDQARNSRESTWEWILMRKRRHKKGAL